MFNGPLDESPPNRQAGLVVNWLGSEALRRLNLNYDAPETIFTALHEVFRPIGNHTMSRFKFKSLKQKQGSTVNAYMAELKVLIHECGYEDDMQTMLLKDQFIFGVTVREIQEHLLNEIGDDHDLNMTLVEARKIKSRIAQCKLLGLKSVQYDVVNQRGRSKKKSKNKDSRQKSRSQSSTGIKDCKYCGNNHPRRQCPTYGKDCKACGCKNHFAKKYRSRSQSSTGNNNKRSFKYRQINANHEGASSDEGQQIDEITSKVKSLYYNDVHFNSLSTQMHISLSTRSCNRNTRKTHFKVNTGADGNLLPLAEFFKHFPDAHLNDLARTIEPNIKLYADNNTEIQQLGICELLVEYKHNTKVCEFYVADFPTAILGIHDSETLKLLTVHFNTVETEISQGTLIQLCIHAIQNDAGSDKFTTEIK